MRAQYQTFSGSGHNAGSDLNRVFPSLTLDPALGRTAKKKRIAIVTADLLGPIKNGGVGTAYSALGELLAEAGHDVTIVFANTQSDEEGAFHLWQKRYKQKNITLVNLKEPSIKLDNLFPARRSYAVYEMMRELEFDIIHFPDLYGLGYFCQLAKRQGLAFRHTIFCVIFNGPQAWSFSTNAQLPHNIDQVQLFHFERKSVEWADVLVSPSQYGLRWAVEQGWKLPQNAYVEQYVMPSSARIPYRGSRKEFTEIVFFGRLETRKGLELFCSAVERLPRALLKKIKITFLGRYGFVQRQPADEYLKQRLRRWGIAYEVIEDFNQEEALEYLRNTQPLVVIPSKSETLGFTAMECLESGLPFLASRIPAFQELIATECQEEVLFAENPGALAEKITECFRRGAPKAQLRVAKKFTNKNWLLWHEKIPVLHAPQTTPGENPLVSVCIVHRNRSPYLRQALDSIARQTYRNFEIVLVDDGSDAPEARQLLDQLQPEFTAKDWRIEIQKESVGPGACRNRAVELARGEFVLLMDDDNVAKPEELETLLKIAHKTHADIVTCGFDRFRGSQPDPYTGGEIVRFIGTGDDLNQAVFLNVFGDTNSLYRRSVYLDLGGYAVDRGVGYEDFDFFLRAVLAGYHLEACPDALFWYREHHQQYSHHTDSFQTLLFRMRNFSRALGQDLRPLVSLFHSASIVPGQWKEPERRSAPLLPSARTELFSGLLKDLKPVASTHPKFVSEQGAKILWRDNCANVHFPKRDSSLLFSFPSAGRGGKPSYFLTLNLTAIETGMLSLAYEGAKSSARRFRKIRRGKNRLSFKLGAADLSRPIQLKASGLSTMQILDFDLYQE